MTTTALIGLSCSVALAGGMPDGEQRERMSTLDEALMEVQTQGQTQEPPPVKLQQAEPAPQEIMAAPVKEPEPVPQIEQDEPAPAKPMVTEMDKPTSPVPNSRIVEVQPNSSFFGLSVGLYDPFTHSEMATSFNLEYQPGVRIAGVLQPIFGAMITTDATMYGYTGFGVPFNLTDNVMMMPSIAAGIYDEGDGVDLDSSFAVRFGTELAYQFENKSRIGLNAHVITNGKSLDKEDRTEVISIVYTTPLSFDGK